MPNCSSRRWTSSLSPSWSMNPGALSTNAVPCSIIGGTSAPTNSANSAMNPTKTTAIAPPRGRPRSVSHSTTGFSPSARNIDTRISTHTWLSRSAAIPSWNATRPPSVSRKPMRNGPRRIRPDGRWPLGLERSPRQVVRLRLAAGVALQVGFSALVVGHREPSVRPAAGPDAGPTRWRDQLRARPYTRSTAIRRTSRRSATIARR